VYFGILNLVGDGGLRGSAGKGTGRDNLYPLGETDSLLSFTCVFFRMNKNLAT